MSKFVAVILSIFLCLATSEIFLRAFYPQSQYSVTYASWGWKHIPNTTVMFWGEKPGWRWELKSPVKIKYDSYGLRSNNVPYKTRIPKEYNPKRILILGDSFAEDMGSPYANLISVILRKKFDYNEKGEDTGAAINVINAGHYGFCDGQELMYYILEGIKYKPDIVLIFYSGDTANPNYAVMENGELVLKWKTFTWAQEAYKNIVSVIRLHSHLGSFILNSLHRVKWFDSVVNQKGLNENIKIINFAMGPESREFAEVDKAIWLRFKELTISDGARFIIMNCMGKFTLEQRKFLDSNGIENFEITGLPDPEKARQEDKKNGCYDPGLESHRFGYKNNFLVSEKIYEYLKEKGI